MKYKGVLHIHSKHSYDGKVPLTELKKLFTEKGLSFACMTEHADTLTPKTAARFVAECRELSDESFVFVPGFEVPYKDAHILHIGATEFTSQFADKETLKVWREKTSLVVLAHPVRNKFIIDEVMEGCIDGVEIWNQQYEGKVMARPRSMKLLRELRNKKSLIATGGLDLHRVEHMGSPITEIEASELSESSIVNALKSGSFQFGNGNKKLEARTNWQPTFSEKKASFMAIVIIEAGKKVNAFLASLGLSLPKSLRKSIRARV